MNGIPSSQVPFNARQQPIHSGSGYLKGGYYLSKIQSSNAVLIPLAVCFGFGMGLCMKNAAVSDFIKWISSKLRSPEIQQIQQLHDEAEIVEKALKCMRSAFEGRLNSLFGTSEEVKEKKQGYLDQHDQQVNDVISFKTALKEHLDNPNQTTYRVSIQGTPRDLNKNKFIEEALGENGAIRERITTHLNDLNVDGYLNQFDDKGVLNNDLSHLNSGEPSSS